jgi:predicted nucleotidyltransferase
MDKNHTKLLENRNASKFPYQVLNNNEFDRICYRTIEKLKKYPMFDGLILTGSFAKDNQDIYSDIDFMIVVQEKSLADGFALWKSFLSCLNSVLVLDELAPLEWISSLETTSNGIFKIDYDFVTENKLQEMIETSFAAGTGLCHGKILFDKSGTVQKAYDFVHPPDERLQFSLVKINQFIITAWSAIRMLYRGELFEAYDIVNSMRNPHILSLLMQLHETPFENYRHFEEKINPEWKERIAGTICGVNGKELVGACLALISIFQDLWKESGNKITDQQKTVIDAMEKALISYKPEKGDA